MARTNYSAPLKRMLIVRGVCRIMPPLAVAWGVYDWFWIRPLYSLVYAALTANYLLVYALSWTAPHLLNGPWRIRPWQTFVLLINAVVLPVAFHRCHDRWPWYFIAVQVLLVAALYVSTAILFYFNERLPMSNIFQSRRGGLLPAPPPSGNRP